MAKLSLKDVNQIAYGFVTCISKLTLNTDPADSMFDSLSTTPHWLHVT